MTEIKLRLLGDRVSRRTAWRIARENGWDSLRDAEYLAVARLQADALVTVDQRLADAARDVVPVAAIDVLLTPGLTATRWQAASSGPVTWSGCPPTLPSINVF